MKIRPIRISDIPELPSVKPGLPEETIRRRLDEQGQGKAEWLGKENGGRLVGYVYLKWYGKKTHPDYPDMEDLYVAASDRGKGYGEQLIRACEQLAKEKGYHHIGLAVNPTENAQAKALYERLGYIHDGGKAYLDGIYEGIEDWVIDLSKNI